MARTRLIPVAAFLALSSSLAAETPSAEPAAKPLAAQMLQTDVVVPTPLPRGFRMSAPMPAGQASTRPLSEMMFGAKVVRAGLPQDSMPAPQAPTVPLATQMFGTTVTVPTSLPPGGPPAGEYGCSECSRPMPPNLTAEVNWLFMQRGPLNDAVIFQSAGGGSLLNASDYSFNWQSGVEIVLGDRLRDGPWTLSARYLWLSTCTDTRSLTVTGADALATTPLTTRGFTTFDNVVASTRFQTADIDLRLFRYQWLSWTAGFRYVQFEDTLTDNQIGVGAFPGAAIGFDQFSCKNHMYGLQIGADANLWSIGRWRFEGLAKAGVYLNEANSSARANFPALGTNVTLRDSTESAAFLGETGVQAAYQISNCWRIVAGYRFIYLSGIATAANQIRHTTDIENLTVPQRTQTDTGGSAFFHGLTVGLQWTF